jgi:tyrosyl-tRNA synthetase
MIEEVPWDECRGQYDIEDFLEAMDCVEMKAWFFRRLVGKTRTFVWDGEPIDPVKLINRMGLADSISASIRMHRQNGISFNNEKIAGRLSPIEDKDFIDGEWLWVGVGKSDRHLLVKSREILNRVLETSE